MLQLEDSLKGLGPTGFPRGELTKQTQEANSISTRLERHLISGTQTQTQTQTHTHTHTQTLIRLQTAKIA